ncbi:MAG: hypothetical protein WDN29_15085 [Methylovirgula sp.]
MRQGWIRERFNFMTGLCLWQERRLARFRKRSETLVSVMCGDMRHHQYRDDMNKAGDAEHAGQIKQQAEEAVAQAHEHLPRWIFGSAAASTFVVPKSSSVS